MNDDDYEYKDYESVCSENDQDIEPNYNEEYCMLDDNDKVIEPIKSNDFTYRNSLIKLNTTDMTLTNDKLYFRYKLQSRYYETIPYDKHKEIRNKKYLYELIITGQKRKLFMDFDKCLLSYTEIHNLIKEFSNFLKIEYNFEGNLTYRIHLSIKNKNETFDPNVKSFKSIHIIYNVFTKTNLQAKQVVGEFIKWKKPNSEFIDMSCYSKQRILRTLYQSKEPTYANPVEREDHLYATEIHKNLVRTIPNKQTGIDIFKQPIYDNADITSNDFITYITQNCVELNVIVKDTFKPIDIKFGYNLKYEVNTTHHLKKFIDNIKPCEFIKTTKWKNNLSFIITTYYISGCQFEDILTQAYMIEFLELSKVGKYKEAYNKNVEYITNICNRQLITPHFNHKYFDILKDTEIQFIYKKLNLLPTTRMIIREKKYNPFTFVELEYCVSGDSNKDGLQKTALFSQIRRILLESYNIVKTKVGKTFKYEIQSDCQHLMAFEEI
jgi:hypothetical protein